MLKNVEYFVFFGVQSLSMLDSLQPHGLQHIRLPFPLLSPEACSNSCPLSQWCHPTISSSIAPFSSCLLSFSAPGSFLTSRLFASGGQSIGASPSAPVLPMNIQDWFPLGLTGLISSLSKGFSRVFSSITVWKNQFFSAQPSLSIFTPKLSLVLRAQWKTKSTRKETSWRENPASLFHFVKQGWWEPSNFVHLSASANFSFSHFTSAISHVPSLYRNW